ncbi:hypothetical protein MASR1M48_16580 [Lactococcus petauri]
MKILGLDTETTGLDQQKDEVTELGLVLWDWEGKKPLKMSNYLIKPTIAISDEASRVSGLTEADFTYAKPIEKVNEKLEWYLNEADYVMAHNAPFDKSFVTRIFATELAKSKLWIDSRTDIIYDDVKHKNKNLVTLAATHGFLNPFPHRALFDVMTMLKVASHYDLEVMVFRANSPTLEIHSLAPFAQKDEVKAHGFYWDADRKVWFMNIKECDLATKEFPFQIKVSGPAK